MPDLPQNVFYHLELCLAGHHGVVEVGPIKGQLGRGYLKPKTIVNCMPHDVFVCILTCPRLRLQS